MKQEEREIATRIAIELLRKSGVLEWKDEETRKAIGRAAIRLAKQIVRGTEED